MSSANSVVIPVGRVRQHLDNDHPNYVFSPDLYLTLALAYDSLAGPRMSQGADGIFSPVFEDMQPRLAESWQEHEDGSWVVNLRPGVISNQGNEFTADDLVFTFEKIKAQGVMAYWRWFGVLGVTDVRALGRYTVKYVMRAPYPTFPNWLLSLSPNMVDATAIKANTTSSDPWGLDWLDGNIAGFGAYGLSEMTAEHLLFAARGDAWSKEGVCPLVDVQLWSDRADAIAQLRGTAPAVVLGLDPDEAAPLFDADNVRLIRTWAGHLSVELDFTMPPFNNLLVRQALAWATPYEAVRRDGLLGLGRPWNSPVKGISQWYLNEPLPYQYQPKQAKELLRQAGYADGFESELFVEAFPFAIRIGEILQKAWAEVGVVVHLRDLANVPAGEMPVMHLRTECGHNTSEPLYDLAHDYAAMNPLLPLPGGEPHVGNWRPLWKKNPEVIEQLIGVLLERDRGIKRSNFDDLQRFIVSQSTSLFLAEQQQIVALNDAVPFAFMAPETHLFHTMLLQNAKSDYLPNRPPLPIG